MLHRAFRSTGILPALFVRAVTPPALPRQDTQDAALLHTFLKFAVSLIVRGDSSTQYPSG
jgi:hypothetical protein